MEKIYNIDGALLSQGLIEKIKELQGYIYPGINTSVDNILQEIDDITCDLADMSIDDPEAPQGKYLSIIQALREYRRFFALLIAA